VELWNTNQLDVQGARQTVRVIIVRLGVVILGWSAAALMNAKSCALAVAAVITVAAAVAGCAEEAPTPATFPGVNEPFGAVIPNVKAGQSWTFGSIPVCTPTGTPLEVTRVDPDNASTLEVHAFAVRSKTDALFGSDAVTLAEAGFDPSVRTVSATCGVGEPDELAIEVLRPDGMATVTTNGFMVESGSGETMLPFVVTLCSPEDGGTPDC
jgi:hypothetical protein